jgi:molybdate transport system substrate-binding protein
MPANRTGSFIVFFTLMLITATARAGELAVAVASNFLVPARDVAHAFEQSSGHQVRISSGSTGKLYAQIVNGAPYDVFIAADEARPRQLEQDGLAVRGTRFTYALGKLVLWSIDADKIQGDARQLLTTGDFRSLVIANPRTAPYGIAAKTLLDKLDARIGERSQLIYAENIAQAFQYTASGNVELGLVALSSLKSAKHDVGGSKWIIPLDMYEPIRQQAILLKRAQRNDVAREFLASLRQQQTRQVLMAKYGYGMDTAEQIH